MNNIATVVLRATYVLVLAATALGLLALGADVVRPFVVIIEPVSNSLSIKETAAPGLSEAGSTRLYVDSTTHTLQASQNGGAFGEVVAKLGTQVVIADGTITNPGLVFAGEPNPSATGIYLQGNDSLGVTTGGALRFHVTSAAVQSATGVQMISLGGDAVGTPNFQVEAGEGMYDCGTQCIALAANAIDVFNADATDTLIAQDDTVETITDTGSNGSFTWALDGTLRLTLQTGGHITSGATATADAGTGTCTAVTVAGNDVRGTITATCTIGQTVIMNFGTGYVAAPICVVSGADGDAVTAGAFATTSTTALTLTAGVGVAAAQIYKYHCIE